MKGKGKRIEIFALVIIFIVLLLAGCGEQSSILKEAMARNNVKLPARFEVKWTYDNPTAEFQPKALVVLPDDLLLALGPGDFFAFSRRRGRLLWHENLGTPILVTPEQVAAPGEKNLLYVVGNYDNTTEVRALNARNGRLEKKLSLGPSSGRIVWRFADGWVYVWPEAWSGQSPGYLSAVDLKSWRVVWQVPLATGPEGRQIMGRDFAAGASFLALWGDSGSDLEAFYLLYRNNGRAFESWVSFPPDAPGRPFGPLLGSIVLLRQASGDFQAIDLDQGKIIWQQPLPVVPSKTLGLQQDSSTDLLGFANPAGGQVQFFALARATGRLLWSASVKSSFSDDSWSQLADGTLIFFDAHELTALSGATGQTLWQRMNNAVPASIPLFPGKTAAVRPISRQPGARLFVDVANEQAQGLVMLDPATGETRAAMINPAELPMFDAAASDGDEVYLFSLATSRLAALQVKE